MERIHDWIVSGSSIGAGRVQGNIQVRPWGLPEG